MDTRRHRIKKLISFLYNNKYTLENKRLQLLGTYLSHIPWNRLGKKKSNRKDDTL